MEALKKQLDKQGKNNTPGRKKIGDQGSMQLSEEFARMAAQQEVHHGVLDVRVSYAKTDSSLQLTNVFLVLCYGDSTNEGIAVPMVEREGRWRMR